MCTALWEGVGHFRGREGRWRDESELRKENVEVDCLVGHNKSSVALYSGGKGEEDNSF